MVRWGGTARPGPLFAFGVAFFIGMIVAFALVVWWLYLSPMPASAEPRIPPALEQRRLVAMFVPIAGLMFVVGGVWDEAWHNLYGGFGDDFLWPPHFLLYSGLGMIALFALANVVLILRRGGDLRQRFREEPLIGLIGLTAGFLIMSLPSDQLWHTIYGVDITAWSLPHMSIAVGFALVMWSAISLQLSFIARGPWRGLAGLRVPEAWVLLQIACGMLALYQLGTAEWDGITAADMAARNSATAFRDAFWQRPEWLFPVVLAALSLFTGNLALHALRRAGAATLTALLIAGFRLGMAALFSEPAAGYTMGATGYLLLLAPALALDAWYALRLRDADHGRIQLVGSLLATAALLGAALPTIALFYAYPRVNAGTLPGMIIVGALVGLGAGWLGANTGGWLAGRERVADVTPARPATRWLALGTSAAALCFALFLILTAQPPSA